MIDTLKMVFHPSSEQPVVATTGVVNESPPHNDHHNLASQRDFMDYSLDDNDDQTSTGYLRHQQKSGDIGFKKTATSQKDKKLFSQSKSSSSSSSNDDSDDDEPHASRNTLMTSRRLEFSVGGGGEDDDDDHSSDTDHYSSCVEKEEDDKEFVADEPKGCKDNKSETFVRRTLRTDAELNSRVHNNPATVQKTTAMSEVVESTSKNAPSSLKKTFNIKIPKTMVENTPFKVSVNDDLDTASWSSSEWHVDDDEDEEEEKSDNDFLDRRHPTSNQKFQHDDDEDEAEDFPFVAFDDYGEADGGDDPRETTLKSTSPNRKISRRAYSSMISKPHWSIRIFFLVLLLASGMIELPKITFENLFDWIGLTPSNQTSFVGVKRPSRVWSAPTTQN